MRSKLIILTAGMIFITSTSFVQAMDINSSGTPSASIRPSTTDKFFDFNEIQNLFKEASNSANRKEQQLQNVIKAADEMITNRITTLNALNTRIQGDTKLSVDEKTSLATQIQTTVTGLNGLKTTIDADTDLTKAKADAKLIVTNYFVYAVLEPKIRMFVTLNNLQTTSTNIAALIPKVQALVTTLGSQGKDVSGLNSLLTDITTQLTTINTTIAADIDSLNAVTTTTTNAKDVFAKVRDDLNTIVRTDFAKIREDFGHLRGMFHQIVNGGSAEPSSTP